MNENIDPHGLLTKVHPDLVKVLWKAAQACTQEFEVVQGLRTLTQEREAVASGHSETMRSRHLPDDHYGGVAMAVDVAALVGDPPAVNWDASYYTTISVAMKNAALALGIPIEWGGDWTTLKDLGHYQLPWKEYP